MSQFKLLETNDFETLNKKLDLIINKVNDLEFPVKDPMLDNNEVTNKFKISSRTLQNWRDTGLKFSKIGKKCYYYLKDIENFIAQSNS